jgi:hypothetical protein
MEDHDPAASVAVTSGGPGKLKSGFDSQNHTS